MSACLFSLIVVVLVCGLDFAIVSLRATVDDSDWKCTPRLDATSERMGLDTLQNNGQQEFGWVTGEKVIETGLTVNTAKFSRRGTPRGSVRFH